MHIKKMYIADFGIIRNKTLDNISNELIVIEGLTRPGKSTFMEILRHIAWGFPKNMTIPFSGDKYDVSCDLQTDKGLMYNIRLSGYAEPSINILPGTGTLSPDNEMSSLNDDAGSISDS